jgi:hypothetical protein
VYGKVEETPGSNVTTPSFAGSFSPSGRRGLYNAYVALSWLLMLWVVANCLYVSLVLKGDPEGVGVFINGYPESLRFVPN